jgi:hypothetical protein
VGEDPSGRSYHTAFGPKDNLMVFDVWTSQDIWAFGVVLYEMLTNFGRLRASSQTFSSTAITSNA